ncbi:MAG TPA: hypothetical protein EYQ60_20110, partial [Myxococcales bacterium]|nr:hypothetical protein [Myxococcales bacterium]
MKSIVIVLILVTTGCSSAMRVGSATDPEVCEKHASYSIRKNSAGIQLTMDEINKRNIDDSQCLDIANKYIENNAASIRLEMCQQLALYNFKGSFVHYSKTLEAIKRAGYYDKECEKM